MKKYLLLVLTALCGLASCGNDDKPYVKPLNKLTKVTCTEKETGRTVFSAEITYLNDGKVTDIQMNTGEKLQFIYVGSTMTVSSSQSLEQVEYALSGNAVTSKKVSKVNEYASHVKYVSDAYTYHYTGSNMTYADWMVRWPNPDGLTYQEQSYPRDQVFSWANGNVSSFTKDKKVIEYTYGGRVRPVNMPFRVVDTFSPVGFEVFSPVNLMMGGMNREMPEKAYWYTIPDTSAPGAEYTFQYTTFGDYLLSMTIEEVKHEPSGNVTTTYHYAFEYNYESK